MSYAFTDVAGEHYLVIGPGGFAFTTDPSEAFRVVDELEAMSFEAWLRNEHDCHVRRVSGCTCDDESPLRYSIPLSVAASAPVYGQTDWDVLNYDAGGFALLLSADISDAQADAYFESHDECTKIETPSGYCLR